MLGTGHDRFPWLVKYLDAHDWLSVQVHPDDDRVTTLWPGENGKTEAWFVLDARPASRIYAGLLPGVDEPTLRRALATGHVADCLHSFAGPWRLPVSAGGNGARCRRRCPHGEVQQSSDATFRLFDWNRVDALGKPLPCTLSRLLPASTGQPPGPSRPRLGLRQQLRSGEPGPGSLPLF